MNNIASILILIAVIALVVHERWTRERERKVTQWGPVPESKPEPTSFLVILGCGHWFQEGRIGQVDPDQPRVCDDPRHYPRQYSAVTLPLPDKLPERGVKHNPNPSLYKGEEASG